MMALSRLALLFVIVTSDLGADTTQTDHGNSASTVDNTWIREEADGEKMAYDPSISPQGGRKLAKPRLEDLLDENPALFSIAQLTKPKSTPTKFIPSSFMPKKSQNTRKTPQYITTGTKVDFEQLLN